MRPKPGALTLAALAAMRDGAATSVEIAVAIGRPQPAVSVLLISMEDRGLVRRRGRATPWKPGRPPVVWHIVGGATP